MNSAAALEIEQKGFESWAILELMGHRRLFGRVVEQTIAGHGLLRVDVFEGDAEKPSVTQFYSPASLYCMTPTTEAICRQMGMRHKPEPVSVYELPRLDAPSQSADFGDE